MSESYDILGINFEGGDLSDWTSSNEEGSNIVSADTVSPIHGSYSAKFTFDGTNNSCYLLRTISGSEIYARWYIRLNADFAVSSLGVGFGLINDSGANPICYLRCGDASLSLLRFYYRTDSGTPYLTPDAFTFLVDTAYYIEYYFKQSSGADDGAYELKINGTTYASISGVDNDTIVVNHIRIGQTYTGVPTSDSILYADDLIINNATSGWPGAYSDSSGSFLNRNYWWFNLG
jgi:hypothetical protein